MASMKHIHVAVGVIQRANGDIFIAQRPLNTHQGGLWEFPGGKVEPGETTPQALARELREELAIELDACEPLIQIRHDYSDKSVLLDVYRVRSFRGEPRGNEGQPVRWVNAAALDEFAFPAANQPIIKALRLPELCAISGESRDERDYMHKLAGALDAGVGLFVVREPGVSLQANLLRLQAAVAIARAAGTRVQLNTCPDDYARLAPQLSGVGLHLSSRQLQLCTARPVAAEVLLGASCHNAQELHLAQQLGVDYVFLSPVLPTRSHPDAEPLGWDVFAELAAHTNIPVYALGGVTPAHLPRARDAGAQGIAAIGAFWGAESLLGRMS